MNATSTRYLIVGTGPAGVAAAEELRRVDAEGRITLVGNEPEPPYSRMALPYLLAGSIGEEGTHLRHDPAHFASLGASLERGEVRRVDASARSVALADGREIGWDRLLIATGAHTTRPPIPGIDLPGVENCWTLADARAIAERARAGSRVVLMGAGFIGCIVLEALAARGVELTVVEMADRMLARMMDERGGDLIRRWCEDHGVRVRVSTRVTGIERDAQGRGLRLHTEGDEALESDLVVCATGVRPNLDLLEGTGIATDIGILVDAHLETSVAGIYAAGDVAQGPDFSTGEREVHAIQPTATEHGRLAARNMAGERTNYRGSLSMNVLNTLGLVSSSFGLWAGVDGGERALALDAAVFRYLRLEFDGDRLVGALALGLTEHVGILRGLVQTGVALGEWKEVLLHDPSRLPEAYIACTRDLGPARYAARAVA